MSDSHVGVDHQADADLHHADAADDVADARAAVVAAVRAVGAADSKMDRVIVMLRRHFRLGLVAIMMAGLVGALLLNNQRISLNNQTRLLELQEQVRSCTEPGNGHACYERGQAATAKAVTAIVDTNGNGKADNAEILDILNNKETP